MILLYKFYDLISRNANVTLASTTLDKTYFDGNFREMPDSFGEWKVTDFSVSDYGDFLFQIEQ